MMFKTAKNIRFSHCDPAGIVFYPRYAELCNEIVEDWFRDALRIDFRTLQETLRLSIPAVQLQMEFVRPSSYGDQLTFSLEVLEIGRSSLALSVVGQCGSEKRIDVQLKLVMISLDTMRSFPIDTDWRARFSEYLR